MMSRVPNRDTGPERRVRSFLHHAGLRFRIHGRKLLGSPDIVLPKYRAIVFVHGCFWHQHPGCPRSGIPKSNREYWRRKFERTQERDAEAQAKLGVAGWRVKILWECEIDDARLEHLVRWIRRS
jgi:DNA mismatch endonuclease (patch repair protein)